MPKYTAQDLTTGKKSNITIDEKRDFLGSGGEKKVYGRSTVAYGIYHDFANALPVEKCHELAVLTHPGIVRPTHLLFKGSQRVGEAMTAIQSPWVLTSLFTKTFCKDHKVDEVIKTSIIQQMNEMLVHAHSHSIFAVDNNENNWLTSDDFSKVYAIDTGNWQTPNHESQFVMLNIKDPFNNPGEKADWFAQAILIASLLIGKHPFEANHPDFSDIPKAEEINGVKRRPRMEAMMQKKVAFWDHQCKLNRACYPLDIIPSGLSNWLQSTLMGDCREAAPTDFNIVAVVRQLAKIVSSRKFDIKLLETVVGDIIRVSRPGLTRTILTTHKWYVGKQAYGYPEGIKPVDLQVGYTFNDSPILAWCENSRLKLWGTKGEIPCTIGASQVMAYEGRLLVVNGLSLTEVDLKDLGGRVQSLVKKIGQVMDLPNATRVFPGCVIQNMLGSWRVNTSPIKYRSVSTRLEVLEGQQIIDAKYENGVLVVIGQDKTGYNRYVWFEDSDNELHLVRSDENVEYSGINFTCNDRGIMTMILEDGTLEAMLSGSSKGIGGIMLLEDDAITTEMSLSKEGPKTLFFRANELYSLKVV